MPPAMSIMGHKHNDMGRTMTEPFSLKNGNTVQLDLKNEMEGSVPRLTRVDITVLIAFLQAYSTAGLQASSASSEIRSRKVSATVIISEGPEGGVGLLESSGHKSFSGVIISPCSRTSLMMESRDRIRWLMNDQGPIDCRNKWIARGFSSRRW